MEEFEQMYVQKESEWPDEFNRWINSVKGRARSLKETLKQCMLKPVRVAAGLGIPPNKWDNQRTESLNNVIRVEADNQVSDQAAIHEILDINVQYIQIDSSRLFDESTRLTGNHVVELNFSII